MAGRPKGSKHPDYEKKRRRLVERLRELCLENPTQALSVREMAAGCGVSAPTLNHYFGDRRGIVHAVLEQSWRDAGQFIDASRQPEGSLRDCIERELGQFFMAFTRFGLDRLNAWGLSEGMGDGESGTAYLQYFLEPTLQAAEQWLAHYQQRGDIAEAVNLRYAALTLYAPCLVLFLHQRTLGGEAFRPADIHDFIRAHGAQFAGYLAAFNPE